MILSKLWGLSKGFFGSSNIPIFLIIAGIVTFGWLRIKYLEAENNNLHNQVTTVAQKYNDLATSVEKFKKQISNDLIQQQAINDKIDKIKKDSDKKINKLYNEFNYSKNGNKRNMENIAKQKPGLLQWSINNATKKVGKEIQNYSDFNSNSSNSKSNGSVRNNNQTSSKTQSRK